MCKTTAEGGLTANPVVYPDSKAAIDAARAAYDALTDAEKTLLTAAELETLQAAEAAYAELGKSTLEFIGKDGTTTVDSQQKALYYPAAPAVQDKTFNHWEPVAEEISEDKTIVIQPVYTPNE